MTNRKQYTREFKLEAVRLLESSDKPITDIARELGCSSGRDHIKWEKYEQRHTKYNGGPS